MASEEKDSDMDSDVCTHHAGYEGYQTEVNGTHYLQFRDDLGIQSALNTLSLN